MKTLSSLQALAVMTASLLCITHSYADDALKMKLSVSKVVKDSLGEVSYIPVTTANIGTVVQYNATYSNTLNKPISNVTVTLPIPQDMVFTGETFPSSAQATTDNINYADMPLQRKEGDRLVTIPYKDYKSLRWNIKLLPAHKSVKVALNTIVN